MTVGVAGIDGPGSGDWRAAGTASVVSAVCALRDRCRCGEAAVVPVAVVGHDEAKPRFGRRRRRRACRAIAPTNRGTTAGSPSAETPRPRLRRREPSRRTRRSCTPTTPTSMRRARRAGRSGTSRTARSKAFAAMRVVVLRGCSRCPRLLSASSDHVLSGKSRTSACVCARNSSSLPQDRASALR